MGLRDRLKKIKNRSGSNTPSNGTSTPKIEYYKPGEEPKLKYTSFVASLRKKSVASHSGSETDATRDRDVRRKSLAAQPDTATLKENEVDDTNIANTGVSRPQTATGKPPDAISGNSNNLNAADTSLEKTETVIPTHDAPFSTDELQKALSRATIAAH
jgi:hypothetical protein